MTQSMTKVRTKFPKNRPLVMFELGMGHPKAEAHMFRTRKRSFRRLMEKCRHFRYNCSVFSITGMGVNKIKKTINHKDTWNGAMRLVIGFI